MAVAAAVGDLISGGVVPRVTGEVFRWPSDLAFLSAAILTGSS